jgi:hypothetical protein
VGDPRKIITAADEHPHPEDTKDPIERFEATTDGVGDDELDRFCHANFAELYRRTVTV